MSTPLLNFPTLPREDIAAHLPNALKASPSSLGSLARCERLWYQQKILMADETLTAKQEASFARGTKLHEAIEAFLLDPESEVPDDDLAILALGFLTKLRTSPGLTVESQVSFERAGIFVRGFIDVYTDRGILDFKTTSSIYMWGEKSHTIGKNMQLMIYAWWWLLQRPEATELTIGHLQFQTKGKGEWGFVHRIVTRAHVANYVVTHLDPLLLTQARVAAAAGLDELTPNRTSCNAFGGCPFRSECAKVDAAMQTVEVKP